MGDRLRPLWDFDDLAATRARLRERLAHEHDDVGRAEVHTQLARLHGLDGDRDGAMCELDRADHVAGTEPLVRCRLLLERGRVERSIAQDLPAATAMFQAAFDLATSPAAAAWQPDGTAAFLAVDAAHMAALAADGRERRDAWSRRAVELAESSPDPEVRGWLASLYNNLAWEHDDAGEPDQALELFAAALRERDQRPEQASELAVARWALGRALRRAGRADEALPLLEQALAWTDQVGRPDGWFHEELALTLAAVDDRAAARPHAALALALLPEADPSFTADSARVRALSELA
jgi:tetratricopeptide (TPR) repeat protein